MPHRRHKSVCPCPGSGIRRGAVLKHTSALYLRHAYLTDRNDGAARHRTMTTSRLTNTRRDRGGQIGRGRQRGTTATVGVACDAAAVSGGERGTGTGVGGTNPRRGSKRPEWLLRERTITTQPSSAQPRLSGLAATRTPGRPRAGGSSAGQIHANRAKSARQAAGPGRGGAE